MTLENIAMICHEANRAYCMAIGDHSQQIWAEAPDWQKASAIKGVAFRIENPGATGASMHQSWLNEKIADGWKLGPVKDVDKKEHPCMVPYGKLPHEQKVKDHLFSAVIDAVNGAWDEE